MFSNITVAHHSRFFIDASLRGGALYGRVPELLNTAYGLSCPSTPDCVGVATQLLLFFLLYLPTHFSRYTNPVAVHVLALFANLFKKKIVSLTFEVVKNEGVNLVDHRPCDAPPTTRSTQFDFC
tara:strand:+ start:296 stop:667 length:372 start_codon:yes stop_codon:yes gene_type:complete